PGSNVTLPPRTRAGSGASNRGSIRTLPVKYSADPLPEGCEPLRLISIVFSLLKQLRIPVRYQQELRYRARHELDRRRSGLSGYHGVNIACAVGAVLGVIHSVDLVVDAGVGFLQGDVLLDAAGPDVAFVARLGAAEPGGSAPAPGSDVQVVADEEDRLVVGNTDAADRATRAGDADDGHGLSRADLGGDDRMVARPHNIGEGQQRRQQRVVA